MSSKKEVASSCFLSKNSIISPKLLLKWRGKWTSVFSGKFETAAIQLSQVKVLFLPSSPNSQVLKTSFSAASERSCRDDFRTHCTIPWEKVSRENVLWVFTAIPVVTLSRQNCTVIWLPCKKRQAVCFFCKTQIHDQSCYKEEINEPVWFSGRFEAVTIRLSQGENPVFDIRPQNSGLQKHISLQL